VLASGSAEPIIPAVVEFVVLVGMLKGLVDLGGEGLKSSPVEMLNCDVGSAVSETNVNAVLAGGVLDGLVDTGGVDPKNSPAVATLDCVVGIAVKDLDANGPPAVWMLPCVMDPAVVGPNAEAVDLNPAVDLEPAGVDPKPPVGVPDPNGLPAVGLLDSAVDPGAVGPNVNVLLGVGVSDWAADAGSVDPKSPPAVKLTGLAGTLGEAVEVAGPNLGLVEIAIRLVAVSSGLDTRGGDGLGCNATDCRRAESLSTPFWPRLGPPKTSGEAVSSGVSSVKLQPHLPTGQEKKCCLPSFPLVRRLVYPHWQGGLLRDTPIASSKQPKTLLEWETQV
jgi:hypothetical protein